MKKKIRDCTLEELHNFCRERPANKCSEKCPLHRICGLSITDLMNLKKELQTEIEVDE